MTWNALSLLFSANDVVGAWVHKKGEEDLNKCSRKACEGPSRKHRSASGGGKGGGPPRSQAWRRPVSTSGP